MPNRNWTGKNSVITLDIKTLLKSGRGSVLMEFVLVLPVYIAVMGGTLWIGMKSLDAINLRSADHWSEIGRASCRERV